MQDKYSLAKCEQYGRRLAARLCDQHFASQPDASLDGPAILKFTPVRQLNLLVMRQLLQQWQSETARLRSPYFDFEAPAVQAALTQFMNVLSRHMRLDRVAFEPLLARAAADTLLIVADPIGTFERLLLGNTTQPTSAQLRDNLRYFDIDKDFFTGFIDSLPPSPELTPEFLHHRFELYHAANYKAHQPMQRLVATLSSLLPLTEADLREDGPVSAASAPATIVEKPTAPAPPASAPVVPTPPPMPVSPPPAPVSEPVIAPVAEPAPAIPTFVEPKPTVTPQPTQEPTDAIPLHEKLKASQPAAAPLAETLRAGTASFTERSAPKVETLREAISINQRFSFINELFNGENMEYHAAIQHLDSLPTAEEARTYVTSDLASRYGWNNNRKEEHVNKLLKLIERKFA
ncbi:hypothetical protein Q5H93_19820 [Hymenobacter sp. ASUV-10]|uniref:Uncharacterized protein n=1 Tax=Hymenobacter aranciens TaxID=3063996 RepID=A0ABT9BFF5_9BACT|nr:hypothetical protein [Hymenobacter sp. ASUV-10]MDO7877004.1 hypothetical protein [Hymenobacter sp. ASUV-10]